MVVVGLGSKNGKGFEGVYRDWRLEEMRVHVGISIGEGFGRI